MTLETDLAILPFHSTLYVHTLLASRPDHRLVRSSTVTRDHAIQAISRPEKIASTSACAL